MGYEPLRFRRAGLGELGTPWLPRSKLGHSIELSRIYMIEDGYYKNVRNRSTTEG